MITARLRRNSLKIAVLGSVALAGCTVAPPTGPDVAVMPGPGKTLSQFQQDDYACRQFASGRTGGMQPAQAANQSALGSAAVGTALGAAAGALLGAGSGNAGAGAAIGAGAGLVGGAMVGQGNAARSMDDLQDRYDTAYVQCMATQGNPPPREAPQPQPPAIAYQPYYVAPPPPVYVYPGYVYPRPYRFGYWRRW